MDGVDPLSMVRPRREIVGMSAVLLPFTASSEIDWTGFDAHLSRTAAAGLVPAVNMDTGFVNLLDPAQRAHVIERTHTTLGGARFVAGAVVDDQPGDSFARDAYRSSMDAIARAGGTPVVFPSFGLAALEDGVVDALATLAAGVDRFIAFELSPVFNPSGRIWSLAAFRGMLEIGACVGAKHSSLDRAAEWDRLRIRDEVRPDFQVLTGNDLAIDMVIYGSDYLLGLSTFAPDLFAERDRRWAAGDAGFYELNDALQHLGNVAFRAPVPAYRHDAALFLQLRGWIASDATPDGCPRRPEWERDVLVDAACRLGLL